MGIVNRVVSQAELMDNARELAQQLVNSAPLAIAALKEIYRTTSEMPVEESYSYIRSGVLKHYPSVLHSKMPLKGRWRLPRSAIRCGKDVNNRELLRL